MAYKTYQGEALGRILMVLIKFINEIFKKTMVMVGNVRPTMPPIT